VFTFDGAKVALRKVKTGGQRNDGVEVVEGLSGGETVVIDPPGNLRDGASARHAPDQPSN